MLDRVRESLFATLQPWIEGAFVLDLFAGSGSLGIEALSRGARRVRFVERAAEAYRCLQENVAVLELGNAAELVRADALHRTSWGDDPADIVFLDAPYPLLGEIRLRGALFWGLEELVRTLLAPEGVLVFHAPHRAVDRREFAADLVVRERVYGSNSLWYVQRDDAGQAERSEGER